MIDNAAAAEAALQETQGWQSQTPVETDVEQFAEIMTTEVQEVDGLKPTQTDFALDPAQQTYLVKGHTPQSYLEASYVYEPVGENSMQSSMVKMFGDTMSSLNDAHHRISDRMSTGGMPTGVSNLPPEQAQQLDSMKDMFTMTMEVQSWASQLSLASNAVSGTTAGVRMLFQNSG